MQAGIARVALVWVCVSYYIGCLPNINVPSLITMKERFICIIKDFLYMIKVDCTKEDALKSTKKICSRIIILHQRIKIGNIVHGNDIYSILDDLNLCLERLNSVKGRLC